MISVDLVNATAADHHVTVTSAGHRRPAGDLRQGGRKPGRAGAAGGLGRSDRQAAAGIRPASRRCREARQRPVASLTATPAQLAAEYQKDIDQYDQLDVAQIAVKSKALADQILAKVQARSGRIRHARREGLRRHRRPRTRVVWSASSAGLRSSRCSAAKATAEARHLLGRALGQRLCRSPHHLPPDRARFGGDRAAEEPRCSPRRRRHC